MFGEEWRVSKSDNHAIVEDDKELAPLPDSKRKSRPIDQFFVWTGANIAVTNWALGALPITLGLSLSDAIIMIVLGNLIGGIFFALCTLPGKNTGLTAMVLTRFSFGKKGAVPITLLQLINNIVWLGINSYFAVTVVVEILDQNGIKSSFFLYVVISLLVFLIQVLVAVYGFKFIKGMDRVIVPLMILMVILMTYFAFYNFSEMNIDWRAGQLAGAERFGMMAMIFAAVGIGWPLSWATWASDYSRHVPRERSNRSVFWASYFGMFVATVWLAIVGAVIAKTMGTGLDPAAMVTNTFPVFVIPALILIFLGTISTNVLDVESGGLTLLAMGIRWPKWVAALVSSVIGFLICIFSIYYDAIAQVLHSWMLTLILWITPWTIITILDLFTFSKEPFLHGIHLSKNIPEVRWTALVSWVIGLLASLLYANTSLFQGPLAKISYGADFSWALGIGVTALLYAFSEYMINKQNKAMNIERN
ncbi:cytosine permease [Sporolactobacillus sp. THM7-7]|nr:cytosine permease [Sporolactobacillus sp. THM7-7]